MSKDLAQQTALVTGATAGTGRATALALAARGAGHLGHGRPSRSPVFVGVSSYVQPSTDLKRSAVPRPSARWRAEAVRSPRTTQGLAPAAGGGASRRQRAPKERCAAVAEGQARSFRGTSRLSTAMATAIPAATRKTSS